MNIIKGALQKPVTVIVSILAIVFFSVMAINKMKIDIFPKMGLPTIYVAQPYGGLSPEQMEGFVTSYYEYHFLYVTGVKNVESNIFFFQLICSRNLVNVFHHQVPNRIFDIGQITFQHFQYQTLSDDGLI